MKIPWLVFLDDDVVFTAQKGEEVVYEAEINGTVVKMHPMPCPACKKPLETTGEVICANSKCKEYNISRGTV
jgi:uncharacterized Zn finger protein (UPF0148 family)